MNIKEASIQFKEDNYKRIETFLRKNLDGFDKHYNIDAFIDDAFWSWMDGYCHIELPSAITDSGHAEVLDIDWSFKQVA